MNSNKNDTSIRYCNNEPTDQQRGFYSEINGTALQEVTFLLLPNKLWLLAEGLDCGDYSIEVTNR